ncbi:MAG: homoserine O-acetyltransferase, partial [Armatimonadetes bacterium]|nr:homoserine O-acetyltransferase [Armatimonadota bacterium]
MPERDSTKEQDGSVGLVQTQYLTFAEPPNTLELTSGAQLGPVTLAYETYGELNADRSNAILVEHALSGDAHVAGRHHPDDRKPGWWDKMVGPGKGLDTNRYFVICSNCLGGCRGSTGPGSINPATGRPYATDFPVVTIQDMVAAQTRLIDHLGIERLYAVVGGSMGGMKALQWAVAYPERVRHCVPLATTHRLTAQGIAFDAVGRQAIMADPGWQGGNYYGTPGPTHGLAVARMVGHITYLSEQAMRVKFGRRLKPDQDSFHYAFENEFQVETYLDYHGRGFVERFDANTYLYITKAMDYFDLGADWGGLGPALARTQARFLVVSVNSDWLFPTSRSRLLVSHLQAAGKDVTFFEIDSPYGHDAFIRVDQESLHGLHRFPGTG